VTPAVGNPEINRQNPRGKTIHEAAKPSLKLRSPGGIGAERYALSYFAERYHTQVEQRFVGGGDPL
jgi:hypothetical protein